MATEESPQQGRKQPDVSQQTPALPCPVCRKAVPDAFWHRKKFQCPYCGFMPG